MPLPRHPFLLVGLAAAALAGYAAGASRPPADGGADPIALASVPRPAQPARADSAPASVRGRVVDERGRPVRGAVVIARRIEPGVVRVHAPSPVDPAREGVLSDGDGHFVLKDLPPGRYVFVAIHGHHSPGRSGPVAVSEHAFPAALEIRLTGESIRA